MRIRKTIFGRSKYKPNTFIGGVSSTLNTANLVATKLGVSATRIKAFKIIGSDIEFAVTGSSTYSFNAFGGVDTANANQNITYYYDDVGLASQIPYYAFRYCLNFRDFRFSQNLNYIGNGAFQYTKITNGDLSYAKANITGEWTNCFQFCVELVTVDTGLLGTTGTGAVSFFIGCIKLANVTTKAKYYGQAFRDAGANVDFYNQYVLELAGISFATNCKFKKIELPNCIKFSNEEFYNTGSTKYIKQIIAPKVVSIGTATVAACFRGQNLLELVDIRACKYFYGPGDALNYNFRDAMVSGGIVRVHIFMATSNSGLPHVELSYLKNSRATVVEFYDDNGNYVSTL